MVKRLEALLTCLVICVSLRLRAVKQEIGTGPFKFAEFKPNERITVTRNRDYWKKDRPYLDGIEFTIIRDVSTAHLAFVAGKLDWMAMTIPLLKDVKSQAPDAVCEVTPGGISRNLIVNRDAPPFDNADMRRAMALSLDRKAFINIISEGEGFSSAADGFSGARTSRARGQ